MRAHVSVSYLCLCGQRERGGGEGEREREDEWVYHSRWSGLMEPPLAYQEQGVMVQENVRACVCVCACL